MNEKQKEVLGYLQTLCVKREYCCSELRKKALARLDDGEELVQEIMESLKADKFVDDARYAAAFAREKSSLTGWGRHKIAYSLRAKGIGAAEIEGALREIDDEKSAAKLRKLIGTKAKSLQGDEYAKFKLIKYALSRGYEYDEVKAEVENLQLTQTD